MARPQPTLDEYIETATGKFGRPEAEWEEVEFEKSRGRHPAVFEDFARALIEDKEPPVSAEEGRKSVELMNAITLSSKREKAVALPVDREEYDQLLAELREEEAYRG
jgi:predicted dehydrogenase